MSKKSEVNWTRSQKPAKCQLCEGNNQYEALTCTITPCIFCKSSLHKSNDCNAIRDNKKIKLTWKFCSSKQHTIDMCPEKDDGVTYCQFCQSSNCHASYCNTIKLYQICATCGEKEHNSIENCPVNQMSIKDGQNQRD